MTRELLVFSLLIAPAFSQTESRWEYAMVLKIYGTGGGSPHTTIGKATICYAQASGCRMEIVEVEVQRDPERRNEIHEKFQVIAKTIDRLGRAGYELVSSEVKGNAEDVLFFKRLRK